jgi:hypothetical protein
VKNDIAVKKPQKKKEGSIAQVKQVPIMADEKKQKTENKNSELVAAQETSKDKPILKETPAVVQSKPIDIKSPSQPGTTNLQTTNNSVSAKPAIKEPVIVKQPEAISQQTIKQPETVAVKSNGIEIEKNKLTSEAKTLPVAIKEAPVTTLLPTAVATRKSETIQRLYFHGDSLVLSLYDNGVVDGDTVSVFLNGYPIISKQQLKVSAFKKTIYITPEMDSVELVLFADNLGSIPPNTGLLTVRDGDQTHNVRFSADLQKNAAIVLSRKK